MGGNQGTQRQRPWLLHAAVMEVHGPRQAQSVLSVVYPGSHAFPPHSNGSDGGRQETSPASRYSCASPPRHPTNFTSAPQETAKEVEKQGRITRVFRGRERPEERDAPSGGAGMRHGSASLEGAREWRASPRTTPSQGAAARPVPGHPRLLAQHRTPPHREGRQAKVLLADGHKRGALRT